MGDIVTVGLDKGVKAKGYFLSFIMPLASLILGTIIGHIIGEYLSMPSLEVMTGFIALFLVSFFSFKRLKILDSSSSMVIKSVVSNNRFNESIEPDEMRRYFEYLV
ncbi:MAG: SoxR reducing system RseC family protein [Nitrospirae bacterium]|nr:SoxR reducing system RseC family protein [Nitrospirota bacterium]